MFASALASCGGSGGSAVAPGPYPSPLPTPSGALPSAAPLAGPIMADTWNGFGLYQPFDGNITAQQATADAGRYVLTWGPGKPTAWYAGNPALNISYYLPFDTDADRTLFGDLGHPLSWWQSSSGHPDWILYQCDQTTPAWVGGLPDNVPLDVSNTQVVAYQMALVGPYMQANGYNSLAADVISLKNANGGCGVWTQNHTVWVQKFTGQREDPAWAAAVQFWTAYAQWYLHGLTHQAALLANAPIGDAPMNDPANKELASHIDALYDEGGFTNFGSKIADQGEFRTKVWWMMYIQSLGKPYLVTDLWKGTEPDASQREYAFATYLMGKGHRAAMFTSQLGTYGSEHYWPEYTAPVGSPCTPRYSGQHVDLRKFTLSLVIVNSSGSTIDVTLPQPASAYTDIEGQPVTDPMPVPAQSGLVLLTANGC